MYRFKKELRDQLLSGRTVRYVAHQIDITEVHLSNILNGKKTCKRSTAYCIVKICDEKRELSDYFDNLK